ncbi:MAG: hypothetical protein AB1726_16560 [Planctomycetota bacterium]
MLTLITSTLLALGFAQETAAVQATDAKAELSAVAQKLAAAESYRFTIATETKRLVDGEEQQSGGRGGPGARGEGLENTPVKGACCKGLPMQLATGETEAYKEGEQVVYKGADGKWQVFARSGPGAAGGEGGGRAGRGAGGGEGGGAGQGGEPGARGAGMADRGGMRGLFTLRTVVAPHEMLAGFGSMVADVEKKPEGGLVVFTGQLTADGAEKIGGRGGPRGMRAGGGPAGGGEGPPMETAGTYRLETKDGAVVGLKVEIKRSGNFGERTIETTITRTFTFADLGATKYEVPEEALAQLKG